MSMVYMKFGRIVRLQTSKAKRKHKKRKAQGPAGFCNTPPVSSDKTVVWHWQLADDLITVMFNRHSHEVWCNGEVLDTMDASAEGGCPTEGVLNFYIVLDDESAHLARIQRASTGTAYQLCVSDVLIAEHTQRGQELQYMTCNTLTSPADIYGEPPPAYEDVVGQ